MSEVLIDTHVLAWSLVDPTMLSVPAHKMLTSGAVVYVPPCAFHEITLKVRKGRWDAMAPYADELDALCAAQGFRIAPYTARMAMRAGSLKWDHADPFDRMIATTALEMRLPLVSIDTAFDGLEMLPDWRGRVWAGRDG